MKKYLLLFSLFFVTFTFGQDVKSNYRKIKESNVAIISYYNDHYSEFVIKEPMYFKTKIKKSVSSGFFINDTGNIATVYHGIKNASKIFIISDGNRYNANVVGYDPFVDFAILEINKKTDIYLSFSTDDFPSMGQKVWCFGHPLNIDFIITTGTINSSHLVNLGKSFFERYIRFDAALNPGMSGGPVLNKKSEVIGINSLKILGSGKNGIEHRNNYAISNWISKLTMKTILNERKSVKHYFMGIAISKNTKENRYRLGNYQTTTNEGFIITGIVDGSPAEKAKLKVGDIVLTVNNITFNALSNLQEFIFFKKNIGVYNIKISRNNKILHFKISTREYLPNDFFKPYFFLTQFLGIVLNNDQKVIKIYNDSVGDRAKIPLGVKIYYIISARHFSDKVAAAIPNKMAFEKEFKNCVLQNQIGIALIWSQTSLKQSRLFIIEKYFPVII